MFESFRALGKAVFRNWLQSLSGTLMAVIALVAALKQWTVPPSVWLTASTLLFIWATVAAYHELRISCDAAMDGLLDKTDHQALADELTVMHERGKALMRPPAHLRDSVAEEDEIQAWIDNTLEIMRRHNCTPQEMHHMDIQHADLVGVFEGFKGKSRAVAVRTQRIADIATAHATIARDLGLAARKRAS